MRVRAALVGLAAFATLSTPLAAAEARSSQPVENASELGGGELTGLPVVALFAALIAGIYFFSEEDTEINDDSVSV